MECPLIVLLTDFGEDDWFVASMKGVIKSINTKAEIIDLTHSIKSHSIRDGAFVLYNTYPYYPEKTIFVAVVDPGVGSSRRMLIVEIAKYFFIAPDNGLLTYIIKDNPDYKAVEIEDTNYFLPQISSTFHGRDIFAPVAAHLSIDCNIERIGERISDPILFEIEDAIIQDNTITAPILYIDKFGNLILNIKKEKFSELLKLKGVKSKIGKEIIKTQTPLRSGYSAVGKGGVVAYWGSSGFLEIALNQGNASEKFYLKVGDTIKISI